MRHRSRIVASGASLLLLVGLLAIPTGAQEPKGKSKAAPAGSEANAKAIPPQGVHVPDYFGQLEPPLTPEQRERIYEIQARALRESEAVLTAAQKTSLQGHRAKGNRPSRGEGAPRSEPTPKSEAKKKAG